MEDCTYVIFGATGNLSKVKLIPALYKLDAAGRLTEGTRIVGFGRRDWDDETWRGQIREWLAGKTTDNEVLERLSGGNMSVRFVTQAEYKDKKREDLRETLDIRISDSVGTRDYEMYSGGEAFRVNFAIRLALSEVLAQRAGARLQMLVIDEGFGSQDTQGRQRLVEAINLVKADFAKILVITHIDELKDAFPNRIEVTKTGRGSVVQVI